MRHGLYRSLIIATTTMMLSACAGMTAQQRGTAIGAGIGAVGGAAITGGSTAGAIGGAAVGIVVGLRIARHDSESK